MVEHWDKGHVYGWTEKHMLREGVPDWNEQIQEGNVDELLTILEILRMFPAQTLGLVKVEHEPDSCLINRAAVKYYHCPGGIATKMEMDGEIDEKFDTYTGLLDDYPFCVRPANYKDYSEDVFDETRGIWK